MASVLYTITALIVIIDYHIPISEIVDISDEPHLFFDILPEDWKSEISSNWNEFAPVVKVIGIRLKGQIIGGGLVFSDYTSETDSYPLVAQHYFNNNFLYIGYLWVAPDFRRQNQGDYWLNKVFCMFSDHPFWLSIEEVGLSKFYLRNQFTLEREMMFDGKTDWIYVRKPESTFYKNPFLDADYTTRQQWV